MLLLPSPTSPLPILHNASLGISLPIAFVVGTKSSLEWFVQSPCLHADDVTASGTLKLTQ